MPKQIDESSIVAGVNSVEALLRKSPGKINHLVFLHGSQNQRLHALQKIADEQHIRVHQLPKTKLDFWFKGPHQGVLAFCNTRSWDEWPKVKADILAAKAKGFNPLIVVPAAMEDPRNLGACIRSAVCMGADAILSHNKGSTGLTPSVAKTAAGAIEAIAISQVGDIEKELKELRAAGFTILGLDGEADMEITQANYSGPIVLVVGGEDRGIPPHIRRCCSAVAKIPMAQGAHSFNASVALSLVLYEANRQSAFKRLSEARPKFFQPPQLPPDP